MPPSRRRVRSGLPRWPLLVVGVLVAILVVGRLLQPALPPSAPLVRTVPPIDPQVYRPFTREGAPLLYALWGQAMMQSINGLKRGAAEVVARDARCDTPAYLDLDRSSNPQRIVLLVTCRNQWSTRIEDWQVQAGLRGAASPSKTPP